MPSSAVVCLSTAATAEEAGKIANILVQEELAACVNLVPGVRSIYRWQGKIEDESEVLMVIKSRRSLVDSLVARITALHSYSVPEVVALDIVGGNPSYLAWLVGATRKG